VQRINQKYINNIVLKALREDLEPNGDITTKLLDSKNKIELPDQLERWIEASNVSTNLKES